VDVNGTAALGNGGNAVHIYDGAAYNVIGGDTVGERNVISGNDFGAVINGGHHNRIAGNYLGLDATGTQPLSNSSAGAGIGGDEYNVIENNVIAANGWVGVYIHRPQSRYNTVRGNVIGLDASGAVALGNGMGIEVAHGAQENVIGGNTEAARNVISGNNGTGVSISNSDTTSNTVSGNFIGADASGFHGLPNNGDGVSISDSASGNLIGGPGTGDRNLIFANRNSGVSISGSGTQSNTVQGNWIGLGLGPARQAFPTDQAISPAYATDCTLFVATLSTGVHKSTDCGATWVEVNTGLTQSRLSRVEIPPDATDANTVYALAENSELFVTTDGGANWSLVSSELQKIDRRNLVLSAAFSSDHTMYASAEWWAWNELGGQPGVFKSTDGGITWARSSNGMSNSNVWKVIASPDPAAKDTLFALTNAGIEKSTDGGANWAAVPAPDSNLRDLALSPAYTTDHALFVAAATGPGRVYRSTDGGASWTGFDALRGDPRFLEVSPDFVHDRKVCHGGGWNDWAYCSTDAGARWTATNTWLPGPLNDAGTGFLFAPTYPANATMFVISFAGMSRSTDGGATWAVVRGLHDLGNTSGVSIDGGASYNSVLDNVLSNNNFGASVSGADTAYNVIAGNLIGTDPSGAFAQSNSDQGVAIWGGHHNRIGDPALSGNVISGGVSGDAVLLQNAATHHNSVQGNYIGTDASGVAVIGNWGTGVSLHSGTSYNLIGGSTAGERNIISGNSTGVGLWDSGTVSNTVSGNYIGVDVTGLKAIPNGWDGILIGGGASSNLIGGDTLSEGNIVSGNSWNGVEIYGADTVNNAVFGNYIGIDVSGVAPIGNTRNGVSFWGGASHNLIGGDTPAERNVISGNQQWGIEIGDVSYNHVWGNYIGTDATGTVSLGNARTGIAIYSSGHNNIIEGNVISGNGGNGIGLWDGNTSDNLIVGNRIGTDTAGTAALPNDGNGVAFWGGANHNTVGGVALGEGNLISGNAGNGIGLWDGGTNANLIVGNVIGADVTGAQPLPNGAAAVAIVATQTSKVSATFEVSCPPAANYPPDGPSGIHAPRPPSQAEGKCSAAAQTSKVSETKETAAPNAAATGIAAVQSNAGDGVYIGNGASDNTVGVSNTIAFNIGSGVRVEHDSSQGNTITRNAIFHNAAAGITLKNGGNNGLPWPHVKTVDLPGGTASGTACPNCTVELFSADDEEGRIYEGTTTADGGGTWLLTVGHPLAGPNVTATATDAAGNTSPFSPLFDILWVNLGIEDGRWALQRLGLAYTEVDAAGFAGVNLRACLIMVLLVGCWRLMQP